MQGAITHNRRLAREWAVQMTFAQDANPGAARTVDEFFQTFWDGELRIRPAGAEPGDPPDSKARAFAETIVRARTAHAAEIDDAISRRLKNWTLDRLGSEERAVLRVAAAELLFLEGEDRAPDPVIINEAVDLAKYFGSNESGRFVNGILDAMARRRRAAKAREREESQVWSPSQDAR
ncbi:MAG: transcription antitermination factor NusB [Kiritimatiellae bacterium]|nr:transcription antitermination factor NusB [Kiritimatiellia bacterium]